MSQEQEAGNGQIDGRPMYWENNGDDKTHIFPGGMPTAPHHRRPHDHVTVNNDGGVVYMREGGEVVNNYQQGMGDMS